MEGKHASLRSFRVRLRVNLDGIGLSVWLRVFLSQARHQIYYPIFCLLATVLLPEVIIYLLNIVQLGLLRLVRSEYDIELLLCIGFVLIQVLLIFIETFLRVLSEVLGRLIFALRGQMICNCFLVGLQLDDQLCSILGHVLPVFCGCLCAFIGQSAIHAESEHFIKSLLLLIDETFVVSFDLSIDFILLLSGHLLLCHLC